MAQWVALVAIFLALGAVLDPGIAATVVVSSSGAVATAVLVWWARRRVAALPPEWVSVAFDAGGLHVDTQSAEFPTAGGAAGERAMPTGVRTATSNLVAWDAISAATRMPACWAFTIAPQRHVIIPFAAFSDADNSEIDALLTERGLLALPAGSRNR